MTQIKKLTARLIDIVSEEYPSIELQVASIGLNLIEEETIKKWYIDNMLQHLPKIENNDLNFLKSLKIEDDSTDIFSYISANLESMDEKYIKKIKGTILIILKLLKRELEEGI